MRIVGSNLPTNSLAQLRKDLNGQAQQKQLDEQRQQDRLNESIRREQFAQSQDKVDDRAIQASADAARLSREQRLGESTDLPRLNQVALQSFRDNSPSPEEQLGIELAGIDTYA